MQCAQLHKWLLSPSCNAAQWEVFSGGGSGTGHHNVVEYIIMCNITDNTAEYMSDGGLFI